MRVRWRSPKRSPAPYYVVRGADGSGLRHVADYDDSGTRYVGAGPLGRHSASYSGTVNLVWGGWCTIPTLTDNFTI